MRHLRRFRILLPMPGVLFGFALAYLAMLAPILYQEHRVGAGIHHGPRPDLAVLVIGTLVLGIYRVWAFHPLINPGYRRWLATTPWHIGRPLPAGPVGLVWEDALIVAAVSAPAWARGELNPYALPIVFLCAYLAALAPLLVPKSAGWPFGYAVAFGIGMVVRLAHEPVAALVAASATYLVGWLGLQRSLRHFHSWDAESLDESFEQAQGRGEAARLDRRLGWPFDQLAPRFPHEPSLRASDAVLLSLLAGWWLYCLTSRLPSNPWGGPREIIPQFVLWMALIALLFTRVAMYVSEYRSPLTLFGRIATFRPIVPGYDRVYAAPVAAVLAVVLVPIELRAWDVGPDYVPPITLTVALMVGLLTGPSLRAWRLTGDHRVVPNSPGSNDKSGPFVKLG